MSFDCPLNAKRLAQELANRYGKPQTVFGFYLPEIGIHQYAVWGKDAEFVENGRCFIVWVVNPQ